MAQTTSTADAASALYVEGKELRDAGDLKKSLEKLEAAHALYATPITALEVARARALVGKLRGAIEVLESIERLPVKPNESAKAASARNEAKSLVAQYRVRTPKLALHVTADVRVWIDGDVVPDDALAAPWLVDPGTHHVEAVRGTQRTSQDVRVAEGEQRDVTPVFDPAPLAAPIAQGAAPSGPPPSSSPSPQSSPPAEALPASRGPNVLAFFGLGLGAAGIAVGSITGLVTLSRASDIKPQCRGGVCPASAGLDSAQTLGTVSTVSFVVGGVALGVGVAALIFGGDRHDTRIHKSAWAEPWTTGSMLGVRGGF